MLVGENEVPAAHKKDATYDNLTGTFMSIFLTIFLFFSEVNALQNKQGRKLPQICLMRGTFGVIERKRQKGFYEKHDTYTVIFMVNKFYYFQIFNLKNLNEFNNKNIDTHLLNSSTFYSFYMHV